MKENQTTLSELFLDVQGGLREYQMVHEPPTQRSRSFDFSDVFSCLDASEQEIMKGYLQRISEQLEEEIQKTGIGNRDPRFGIPPFGMGGWFGGYPFAGRPRK